MVRSSSGRSESMKEKTYFEILEEMEGQKDSEHENG
nr:MAG TPA: hypothetical protein [Caudoviricetes sp.]